MFVLSPSQQVSFILQSVQEGKGKDRNTSPDTSKRDTGFWCPILFLKKNEKYHSPNGQTF